MPPPIGLLSNPQLQKAVSDFFNMMSGQTGGQQLPDTQSAPGLTPPPAPGANNNMAGLVQALLGQSAEAQKMNIDFLRSPPASKIHQKTISGNSADSGKPEGLDLLYKNNPHLAPSNFKSPTDPARFNTGVWGNAEGPDRTPPEGTMMKKNDETGVVEAQAMTAPEIYSQMAEGLKPPLQPLNILPNRSGFADAAPFDALGDTIPGVGPFNSYGGTITQNGVISPITDFLTGANRLPEGVTSEHWQSGLTPEERRRLMVNPQFGPAPRTRPRATSVYPY